MIQMRRAIAASLRTRVLLLTLAAFIVVSAPAYLSFVAIVNVTVDRLGTLFAEKQIQFDRYRGLAPLTREVSLAETLAGSPIIAEWALDEHNPAKQARGLAELEHFRKTFNDHSYFFVVGTSGNYYFNDRDNSHAGAQYAYTLSNANPADSWYYKTAALGEGCHLNVDWDRGIDATKVWINCVIRAGDAVIGVLGTGLDLTTFIQDVVAVPQNGVTTMFVDGSGAVQAHRDATLVDFNSFAKDLDQRRTVFNMVDTPGDARTLREMMAEVKAGQDAVRSRFMRINGRDMLVGVGYLDQLGWYNVTTMDVDAVIDRGLFLPLAGLFGIMMAAAAALITWLFKRSVIDRLAAVETAAHKLETGDLGEPTALDGGADEIGRLSRTFSRMADAVRDRRHMLEELVRQRTEELQDLAFRDSLTAIGNRRSFTDAFVTAQDHARTTGEPIGLVLIDIDHFKTINDGFGHQAGDAVMVETARRIAAALGPDDVCARWGGDEIIVLLAQAGPKRLRSVTARLLERIGSAPVPLQDGRAVPMTASIGACLAEPGETLQTVADMADAALYQAKDAGRNRVVIFEPPPVASLSLSA